MKTLYVVLRDSADGMEADCFDDEAMAQEWAGIINGEVQTQSIIDRETMELMRQSWE